MSNQLLLRRRMMTANRPDYLRFTALEDDCSIALNKIGNPVDCSLEYSINRSNFSPYVFGTVIGLDEGDYIEWRRSSENETGKFSKDNGNYYQFEVAGKMRESGLITSLLTHNGLVDYIDYMSGFLKLLPTPLVSAPLNFPSTLTSIWGNFSGNAFDGPLVLPENLNDMGACYFGECFTSVVVPTSVKIIDRYSFSPSMNTLQAVYYEGTLDQWLKINFRNAIYPVGNPLYLAHDLYLRGELLTEFVLPNGYTTIPEGCMMGTSITHLTIPDSVTMIGNAAFYGSSLKGSLVIPDSVTRIGNSAFRDCKSLKSIVISNNVTTIENSTFDGCTGLTGLVIPNSVTNISAYAFRNCSGMTGSLVVPNSVTTIENYAFQGCSFTNVYVPVRISTAALTRASNHQGITIAEGDRDLNAYFFYSDLSNRYMVVKGNLTVGGFVATANVLEALWVGGDLIKDGDGITHLYSGTPLTMFVGVDGTVRVTGKMFELNGSIGDGCILHFASSGIAATPTQACASYSRLAKVYVGDGSSQAADEAVLALYLADADWAQYASKLDIWWNYNGPYKTQPVFPTN